MTHKQVDELAQSLMVEFPRHSRQLVDFVDRSWVRIQNEVTFESVGKITITALLILPFGIPFLISYVGLELYDRLIGSQASIQKLARFNEITTEIIREEIAPPFTKHAYLNHPERNTSYKGMADLLIKHMNEHGYTEQKMYTLAKSLIATKFSNEHITDIKERVTQNLINTLVETLILHNNYESYFDFKAHFNQLAKPESSLNCRETWYLYQACQG